MRSNMRIPTSGIVSLLVVAMEWMSAQGFTFMPAAFQPLSKSADQMYSANGRPWSPRYRSRQCSATVENEGITMRGYSKKGKNHPGLTGVQRVLNTRDREAVVEEPCKVMISNLDFSLTEEDVKEFCSTAGPVAAVKLVKRRYAKTSKGYGFVDYHQPVTATIAIEDLSGQEFHGRVIEIKPAITTREKKQSEWKEEQALEQERRRMEGYVEEEKVVKKAAPVKPRKKGENLPTVDEFLEMVGRTNKPKRKLPVEAPSELEE